MLEGLRKPAAGADGDARADGAGLPPDARASAAEERNPVVWQHGNVAHVERAFRRRGPAPHPTPASTRSWRTSSRGGWSGWRRRSGLRSRRR